MGARLNAEVRGAASRVLARAPRSLAIMSSADSIDAPA